MLSAGRTAIHAFAGSKTPESGIDDVDVIKCTKSTKTGKCYPAVHMEMRFKPVKEGKQEVNQRVCTTLEDAADYCQLLRRVTGRSHPLQLGPDTSFTGAHAM